jgi:DNA-directed RNA polymerase specialized sigma24 family protein
VLAADQELLDALMWRGYSGPAWQAFSHALAAYGYQVVLAWCLSGRIFVECGRKGFGLPKKAARRITRDDASELACETVAASIVYFRDHVLVPRVWDPTRGASLKTFFIGACVMGFANVYRQWRLENGTLTFVGDVHAPSPTGSSNAAVACDIERMFASVPPRDRELLRLAGLGYTQIEIAELLRTTRKAVERRLGRLRTALGSWR